MIYSLENSKIKITASTHGGELHSLTGKKENTEYLWDGNPEYWKYHSPILFPVVGKALDLKYKVDGKIYEIPAHGLARISDFTLISQTENSITFELKYSEDSLKIYPYKFVLNVTYTIEENTVDVTFKVANLDDKEIYFSIGGHPALMCPIEKNEKLEDYYLKFNKIENSSTMLVTEESYFLHERKEYLNNSDTICLSKKLFEEGVLVFDDLKSNEITIESRNKTKSLTVNFEGFPYLGIWAPETGAPFLCIEPWFGHADYKDFNGEFKDREGTVSLSVNKEFSCSYKISIRE
ncbi:aldose 1-epimerase family protein [Clostridium weizhouense]|uniref:Aldose 1-epimerase family protein n=1 Tax=Clostridium weizhouense TaxID=2859781 RepID=A0ABS7ALU5_9CLOT|nr:aldose 1-epimerase family protein [Clostridium weizhouense]MBW6409630.1 aldose 1-epimerase family protein [Clostridium weizhouense]